MLVALIGLGGGQGDVYNLATYLTQDVALALVAGALGSIPVFPWLAAKLGARELERLPAGFRPRTILPAPAAWVADLAVALVLFVSMAFVASTTGNPFIYFRF
jgi:hypothetical protein